MLSLNPHPQKAEGAAPGGTSAAKAARVARVYGTTEVAPSRFLLAAGEAVVVVEDHQDEGGDDKDGGDPAEGLGDAEFAGVAGFVVGDDAAEDEAGSEAATVGPVIDAAT